MRTPVHTTERPSLPTHPMLLGGRDEHLHRHKNSTIDRVSAARRQLLLSLGGIAKDSLGDAIWKSTYWHNGSGPAELPADQHTQHGPLTLYLGVNPVCEILQLRKRPSGTSYRPHPGNVRPLLDKIAALNCLYAEYGADDFDGEKPAILEHIATLPALPSVIIDNGGYHCY